MTGQVNLYDSGDGLYRFGGVEFFDIDFTHLTPAQ